MKFSPLDESMRTLLSKRKTKSTLRALSIAPATSIDFSSNDFLSLSKSSLLKAAYLRELECSPNFRLGSGGSRLLDGNSAYAEQLEKDIADFHRAPSGLLFNSGFDANSGFFSCIPQTGDLIFHDEHIHASVHEGMRLSRAGARVSFAHNSVESLRGKLLEHIQQDAQIQAGFRNVFVAIESLYSMDGDLAPIRQIVDLVEELLPAGNGHIVVDEAHSNGIYGFHGRGIVSSLGLEDRIFARLHTFGKGLACNGAILLCSSLTREYLINYARSLIYTTAMSFPSLVAIKVVYSLMMQGQTQPLISHLDELIEYLFSQLNAISIRSKKRLSLLQIPAEMPQSPIFALLTTEPRSLARYCQEGGFIVRPIVPPTASSRVRVCLHAGNTFEDVERLVARIEKWLDQREVTDMEERSKLEFVKSLL